MATDGKTFLPVSGILSTSPANFSTFHFITGRNAQNAFDSRAETIFREPGVISHLMVKVIFRKNGRGGDQQLVVAASVTGTFEDLVNTDSVSAGDKVATPRFVSGTSGSLTIIPISYLYAATTNTVSGLATCDNDITPSQHAPPVQK